MLKFRLNEGGSMSMMDVGSIDIVVGVGAFKETESLAELWKRGDPGGGGGLVGGAGGPDENSIASSPRGDPGGGGGLVGCGGRPFAFKDELEDFAEIEAEGAGVEAEADVAVEATESLC